MSSLPSLPTPVSTACIESEFSLLAETDQDAIFVFGHQLQFLYVNLAAERLLDKSRQELVGHLLLDVYPEAQSGSAFYEPLLNALWEQVPVTVEGKLLIADRWFEMRIHPFLSVEPLPFPGGDEINGVIVYCRDVTERKRDEENVRRKERLWRDMVDVLPQMICASDPHGNIAFVNRLFTEYTGFSGGQTFPLICQQIVHPDDVRTCSESLAQAMVQGEPWQHEHRLRRASDGQYRWHLIRCTPTHDAKGEVTGWFGVATDVHLRHEAEESLKSIEKRLAVAVNALEAGIFEIDCLTGKMHCSLTTFRLLGIPDPAPLSAGNDAPGETVPFAPVEASDFWKHVYREDRKKVKAALRHAYYPHSGTDGVYEVQYRVVLPDGSLRWIAAKGRITFDDSGRQAIKMLGILRDATLQPSGHK